MLKDKISDILKTIIPLDAEKTILFCEVEKTSYELFFYSFFVEKGWLQCNELVDEGIIDPEQLENVFEKIASDIKQLESFNEDKRNQYSIVIEKDNLEDEFVQFEKTEGLYKIKKEWKKKYLSNML